MFIVAWISIGICMTALVLTLLILRNMRDTLGLPLAYMISLLLIHVPGAYAFAISGGAYAGLENFSDAIARGIGLTAIAALCFVVGTAVAAGSARHSYDGSPAQGLKMDVKFMYFCLAVGGGLTFGAGALRSIPTIGAAIYFGSFIWMLAATVGLASSVQNRNPVKFLIWSAVLLLYPLIVMINSGFMSYGSAAVIAVGSLAVIHLKNAWRSFLAILVLGFLGISVFVNYFGARNEMRSVIWGGAGFEQRVEAVSSGFGDFSLFDQNNPEHLRALTLRLNQNEFVGMAADRLDSNQADYLNGRSLRDALLAPIPRAIWKNKPLEGGSGQMVRDMTGMRLGTKTSWGVGNVMEFYINFGLWSLVPGFLLLGFLITWLDQRAARALKSPDFSRSLYFFLPAVALIQPNGSLVEIVGGAFAALLAALGFRVAWISIARKRRIRVQPVARFPQRVVR